MNPSRLLPGLALCAALPAAALTHSVTDFRLDFAGAAADTFRLDPGWGDSLLMMPRKFAYKVERTFRFNPPPTGGVDNFPAGSSVAIATGPYQFKVGYVQFQSPHTAGNYLNNGNKANVMSSLINVDPDSSTADPGVIIAGSEVAGAYPAPVYLNFGGQGGSYAAYWGPNTQLGPIRRTSHLEAAGGGSSDNWGRNVNPSSPIRVGGYGKVGACAQPGSNGLKYALAYDVDTTFPGGKFEVRWEDIGTGSTLAAPAVGLSPTPEDFALAMDSLGNTVVLYRKELVLSDPTDLWMLVYDPSHSVIIDTIKIETDIYSEDSAGTGTTVQHYYRPYAVAAQANKRFLIAYSKTIGAQTRVYTRSLTLDSATAGSYTLSPRMDMTPPGDVAPFHYMYPDIACTSDRVAIAWFKRTSTPRTHRIMGSIFAKDGPVFTTAGRVDMDFSGEDLRYTLPAPGAWYQYHYMKTASVAMDPKGNVVAAYDSATAAKAAVVRNTPFYYDSAAFLGKSFEVANPGIPSFVFDPARDSVAFFPFRTATQDTAHTAFKLAVSQTGAFAGAAFQPVPARMATNARYYRYKVEMKSTLLPDTAVSNLTTPRVKSLALDFDVKPWKPRVDSLKPGKVPMAAYDPAAAYPLLPRKDSLKIVVSGFDADDDGMAFRVALGAKVYPDVNGTRTAPGAYRAVISVMPPDTVLNPLPLTLTAIDAQGWGSSPFTMMFDYSNIVPVQTVTIYRNKGRDSASVYRPNGGGVDTLHPSDGDLIVMQSGDSLAVKARYADGNDDAVTGAWYRNSSWLGSRLVPTTDSLAFRFAPDRADPWIDTLVLTVADPNVTRAIRFAVRANRAPEVDSVYHASYQGRDSAWKTGPFDRVKAFATDTGLTLPSGLMTVVQAAVSDSDMAYGDSVSVKWKVWRKGSSACPTGNLACYQAVDSAVGETLARVFDIREQYLTVRVTDASGAFRERRLWLEYPVLDTAGTTAFDAAVKSLQRDIDFVIGSEDHDTTVRAQIQSQGSAPLQILSVATKANDRKWLDVKLQWLTGTPPRPDSAKFPGATTANALAGRPLTLPPGATLSFDFRFASDSLRGDSVLADTLLVQTNDFAHPVLKIPFRMVYNDLPVVTLRVPGVPPAGPAGGFNAAGLPRLLPARSSLSLLFSEIVRIPDPARAIRVYSLLDSLKNPRGYRNIQGTYRYVLDRAPKAGAGQGPAFGKASAAADSLADELIFTPAYDRASDSLGVRPPPGFFIYRDFLRIRLSNAIVDRAGNGLDLRLAKKPAAAGTLDTVFAARVDTSYFAVASTEPAAGQRGWNVEDPIRIRFNRKLAKPPPAGGDTVTLLAAGSLKAADSRAVRVVSAFRPGVPYDLQSIAFADGDSTLVLRTRPRLPALDTVTVTLSGGILDTSGLSLDGNGDRFPRWLYDRRDSVDAYAFTFSTTNADFYVFPNPFRFGDIRHREKGSVTFKNLNSLRGYAKGDEVTLRIHTMNGDLVYDSGNRPRPDRAATSLDWDLKNDGGATVGTGVYLYTLTTGARKLLHKGKIAVVR